MGDNYSSDDARLADQFRAPPQWRAALDKYYGPGKGGHSSGSNTTQRNAIQRNTIQKNTIQRAKGKRKRVISDTKESEEGEQGEQGDSIGMSGNGNGNGNGNTAPRGEPTTKPKKKVKRERTPTPPYACELREEDDKKDSDLRIIERGPKMEEGEASRYYAKVVRTVEHRVYNSAGKVLKYYPVQIEESYRMPDHAPVLLAAVDLSLFRTPDCTHIIPDRELVRFAMEPAVLPLLKRWAYMWLNPDEPSEQFHKDMLRTFPMEGDIRKPWTAGVRLIAEHAAYGAGFSFELAPLLYSMSSFARKLVNANGPFFGTFSAYSQASNEQYKFAARMLLVVWEDVEADPDGFFGALMKGELARPNRPEVRKLYEGWYVVNERLFL
jgi:hypothetical protein